MRLGEHILAHDCPNDPRLSEVSYRLGAGGEAVAIDGYALA